MKRFVLPVILIVALIAAAGFFPQKAMAIDATSNITVAVPEYIAIEGLGAITIDVTFSGGPPPTGSGDGTDPFTVEANVVTDITVGTIVQPTTPSSLIGLTGSVLPIIGGVGTTSVTLTASISGVPITTTQGNYTGGSIQVTVVRQ